MNYPIITTNPDHDDQNNEQTTEPSIIPPLRKSQNEKPPIHLMDYNCNSVIHRTSYPITNFISHDNLSSLYSSFCLSLLIKQEPASYAEASQHQSWVKATQNKLNALANYNTWIFVDLLEGTKPIGSK
jgi:hypothetical protein